MTLILTDKQKVRRISLAVCICVKLLNIIQQHFQYLSVVHFLNLLVFEE